MSSSPLVLFMAFVGSVVSWYVLIALVCMAAGLGGGCEE